MMQEYRVNEFLSIRLEGGKTNIYVNNKRFRQCKYLLIHIPTNNIPDYDSIDSIDEAVKEYNNNGGSHYTSTKIPAKTEFWGHCSNIQSWYEHDYDTRLLHSNLSFPLLKELADVGDPKARRVIKDEILDRMSSYHLPVVQFLFNQKYFNYFSKEELETFTLDILDKREPLPIVPILLNRGYLSQISMAQFMFLYQHFPEKSSEWLNLIPLQELKTFVYNSLDNKQVSPLIPKILNKGLVSHITKIHYNHLLEEFPHIIFNGEISFLETEEIKFWSINTLGNSIAQNWMNKFEEREEDGLNLILNTLNSLVLYDSRTHGTENIILVGKKNKNSVKLKLLVLIGETLAAAEVVAGLLGDFNELLSDEIFDWIDDNRNSITNNENELDKLRKRAKKAVSIIYDYDCYDMFSIFTNPQENEEWLENLEELIHIFRY